MSLLQQTLTSTSSTITVVHLKHILIWLRRSSLPINDRRLWWSAHCHLRTFPSISNGTGMSINIKHPRPIPSDKAVLSQLGPHYSLHPPLKVKMNTHSFRKGGATALATAGVPNSVIQIICRWPRVCFLRYIRL